MQQQKSKVGRNVAVMVAASVACAITSATLMFWVPQLMSMSDFGYWRTFLLYAGFAGFAHLGLLDGALLHWSQECNPQSASALKRATQPLLLLHLALGLLVPILLYLPIGSQPHLHAIVIALLVYAWAFNLLGLAQIRLQSQGRFNIVAVAMSGPGIFFLCLLAAFHRHSISVNLILLLYLIAWCTVAAVIWLVAQFSAHPARQDMPSASEAIKRDVLAEGLWHIQAGWPIMLANTGYGLMQAADRITVNLSRPIHDFAIYSLSQSTIYVPVAVISSISRVAFSHFAGVDEDSRVTIYTNTVRVLAFTWAILLPYYYVVEWVVLRFLPKYAAGLPAGHVLLLSVLFLSLISVVQANTASLAGRQRKFFAGSVVAAAFAFLSAWIGSQFFHSLIAVAWSQVVSAATWWMANEAFMLPRRLLSLRDIALVLLTFAAGTTALYCGTKISTELFLRPVLYYSIILIPMLFLYKHSFRGLAPRLFWAKS